MRKGKYASRGGKGLALILSLVLVAGCVVGGTLAWLTAQSGTVTNTFTTSDITVKLEETTGDAYKMIPGYTLTKDPKATVVSGSEACWLFVKLEKSENFDQYLTYEMADGWTPVEGETNVFARKVESTDVGTTYSVLKGDQVTVLGTVTKEMMEAANTAQPKLTITAYAHQLYTGATGENGAKVEFTAAKAWANIQ